MTVLDLFGKMLDIISPILYSVAITYFLSYILNFIERHILRFPSKRTWLRNLKRILSIFLTLLFVLLLLAAAVSIFIPQIIESYNLLSSLFMGEDLFDTFSDNLDAQIDSLISGNQLLEDGYAQFRDFLGLDVEESLLSKLSDYLWNYLKTFFSKATVEKLLNRAWGAGSAAVSFIVDAVVTFILSLYLLFTKEKQIARIKKLVNAFCSPKVADKIYHVAYLTDERVGQYLTVQILDSILVGVVSYFVYMIADLPFYPVLALISGVTNIIPYFGPFLGAIPNSIFILISEPSKLLPFILIVLIIQQIDGNILIPIIQSDNMKMDVFWVLVAMTVMGGIFGLPGMILGVPLFSVLFILIKEQAEELLEKKKLPLETEYYAQSRRPNDKSSRVPPVVARIRDLVKKAFGKITDLFHKKKEEKARRDLPASGRLLSFDEEPAAVNPTASDSRQRRGNRRNGGKKQAEKSQKTDSEKTKPASGEKGGQKPAKSKDGAGASAKPEQKKTAAAKSEPSAPASSSVPAAPAAPVKSTAAITPATPDGSSAEGEKKKSSQNRRRRRRHSGSKKPADDQQ
jgi:predicted PurR-regulated permease PerM